MNLTNSIKYYYSKRPVSLLLLLMHNHIYLFADTDENWNFKSTFPKGVGSVFSCSKVWIKGMPKWQWDLGQAVLKERGDFEAVCEALTATIKEMFCNGGGYLMGEVIV